MIVDAHVHLFPPGIIADRESINREDEVFALMYADPRAGMATANDLIAAMDEDGVDRSIVCGFPWHDTGRAAAHNDYILETAREHPERLVPLAGVDPLDPGARKEAERALSLGAAGLGEIGVYRHDLSDPAARSGLLELARLCAEADKPLLLHANEPVGHDYPGKSPMTLRGLYELIRDCPATRFQLAHLGGGLFLFELLRKEVAGVLKRCVFDTAAAPYLYHPSLYRVFVEVAGEDRLLYGSDFPLLRFGRYEKDLAGAAIGQKLHAKILGENARDFWRLGGAS